MSSGSKDKWDDFNIYRQQLTARQAAQRIDRQIMGIGEAGHIENRPTVADIRIEKIENGYLVVYRKNGTAEKRKYAKDLTDVGEVTKAACIELELTGAK